MTVSKSISGKKIANNVKEQERKVTAHNLPASSGVNVQRCATDP
jgi:hypothetical protein